MRIAIPAVDSRFAVDFAQAAQLANQKEKRREFLITRLFRRTDQKYFESRQAM